MESLVWFRNDLRFEDNPALREAFTHSKKVHAIYIFSNRQLKKHNEANVKTDFVIKNLFLLVVSTYIQDLPKILSLNLIFHFQMKF